MIPVAKKIPPKRFKELQLLTSLRFACLMAIRHQNPMNCPRVRKRIAELNQYLRGEQPSQDFFEKYCGRVARLGTEFALGICVETDKIAVCRLAELTSEQRKKVAA